jgi:type I restriction enzyme M protein
MKLVESEERTVLSDVLQAEILKRQQPFTASDLMTATGASRDLVDQVLSRLSRAGKLQRLSRGMYSSTERMFSSTEIRTLPALSVAPGSAKSPRVASLIWTIAELLRGDVRPADYGSFILPFTVLRRIDCVLEAKKPAVIAVAKKINDLDNVNLEQRLALEKAAGSKFYNASALTLATVLDDPNHVLANLDAYVGGFSPNVRDIFERYRFDARVAELDEKNLLYKVLKQFVAVDLHPNVVSNSEMGDAFENLIRRFAELSNETAGEHYTPRDAIRLAVDLLLAGDADLFTNEKPLRSIYDPTAGTGGMLSVAEDRIKAYNANAKVTAFAQELNGESYAICKADMLIKGQDVNNVVQGNTLADDKFPNKTFDWMLSNPPYGVDWKKVQEAVESEHEKRGFKGRFGPRLPRISDGQMLFLLHLVSKMQPIERNPNGSRIAIVMNGSPLFSGGAGSGESEIRKYLFENDLVEAIVGLPTEMFYNTGIATYIWILSNNKAEERRGKTQLIDGTSFWQKMPRSLGNKRREMREDDIAKVVRVYGDFEECEFSKVLPNDAFGYHTITVECPLRVNFQITPERLERLDAEKSLTKNGLSLDELKSALISIDPAKVFKNRSAFLKALDAAMKKAGISLTAPQYKAVWQALSERDETAEICTGAKGKPEPDADLRDTENVPLGEDVQAYFDREVKPHVSDAWIDHDKAKVGYEIPFTRYFYKYVPPRTLQAIDSDLAAVTNKIVEMLGEVAS